MIILDESGFVVITTNKPPTYLYFPASKKAPYINDVETTTDENQLTSEKPQIKNLLQEENIPESRFIVCHPPSVVERWNAV